MAKSTRSSTLDFESALAELEKIVERMEQGEQSLEASLKDFERGMELSRTCQESLKAAEQRIEALVEKHGEFTSEPFEPEAEGSD